MLDKIKIACTSDPHGHLPIIQPCDLLLVCGDLGPPTNDYHLNYAKCRHWLLSNFDDWLGSVPARFKAFCFGNHELIPQQYPDIARDIKNGIYLEDSGVEFEGLKIWGSPYSVDFCNWAFMESDYMLKNRWARIPDDTNILIVHGPPKYKGDTVGKRVNHLGSHHLTERLMQLELNELKLCTYGHIHYSSGYWDGLCANVAQADEDYNPTNPVYYFEYNTVNKTVTRL